MQIVCIHCTVFELCVREKKKKRKKKKKKKRKTKSKFSHLIFLTVRRINEIQGVNFTLE